MSKRKFTLYFLLLFNVCSLQNVFAQSPPPFVPTGGLIGWWPFSGSTNDESGNGNTGGITGAVSLTKDRFGADNKAYSFGGNGAYIHVDDLSDSLNKYGLSISVWFKLNDISQYAAQSLVARNNDNEEGHFRICQSETDGGIYGEMRVGSTNGVGVGAGALWPTHTIWHHAVYTYDSLNLRIYVDDTLTGNTHYSKPIGYSTFSKALYFGAQKPQGGSASLYVNGKLDDIGIWNRALSRKEIHQLYTQCNLEISGMPASDTVAANGTAQFVVTASNGATYKWQVDMGLGFTDISNAGPFSGADNDTLLISNVNSSQNNTRYRCVLTSGACSDTTSNAYLFVSLATGIEKQATEAGLKVYPNPTNNYIFIEATGSGNSENYFYISDMTGKLVIQGKQGVHGQHVSLQSLSPGIYLLNVKSDAGSVSQKIVVQR